MKICFSLLSAIIILAQTGCVSLPKVQQNYSHNDAIIFVKMPHEKTPKYVVMALREEAAPQTVANFKELVRKHYYDGMLFHRLFAHSFLQTGDPKSRHGESDHSGTGGPGYTIPAEIRLPHLKGAVAASRLPDNINPLRASNGSQFYICLEPMPQLNGQYTVFGQVKEGTELLDAISTIPVNSNNFPLQKVRIVAIKMGSGD